MAFKHESKSNEDDVMGALRPMILHRKMFSKLHELENPRLFYLGDNAKIDGMRVVNIPRRANKEMSFMCPKSTERMSSVGAIDGEGLSTEFRDGNCIIKYK